MHNDSFHQFFDNGGFQRAYATVDALKLLGFPEMADILVLAIEIGKIPNPLPRGFEFGDHVGEGEGEIEAFMGEFDPLFSEFFKAHTNKDWDEKIIDCVRKHPDEFV